MKNLKQFIFKELEEKGYVTDQATFNFLGKEPNFYTVQQYTDQWHSFNRAKKHWGEPTEDVVIHRGHRYCIISAMEYVYNNNISEGYKIPRIYFEYLKEKGVKEIL